MAHQIESFVFFDIETTGLPWQERNQTKIIELSFVVAQRKDIENTLFDKVPPVSKLTFVLNPQRQIHPEVTKLTGLSNDLLQHAPVFGQKLKSIITFLEDLPKPVCLVAHNGNTFDFKIFLAECNDVRVLLPSDLLCVDSLVGFRRLLKGTNINYEILQTNKTPIIDDLLTDDEDWPEINLSNEDWEEIDEISQSLSDISCEDFAEVQSTRNITQKSLQKKKSKAIKKVFDKKRNVDQPKECYKLTALYKRLLNKEEVNAHRAEVDCLMLLQCVVALKKDFLPWADSACKNLTEIKPFIRY